MKATEFIILYDGRTFAVINKEPSTQHVEVLEINKLDNLCYDPDEIITKEFSYSYIKTWTADPYYKTAP